MLKKTFRLNSFALKNPKQVQAKYFSLKFSKNEEKISRFAFVVSKKVDSRSSARNQLKRKVRAGVEGLFEKIPAGYDFIFYPKKSTLDASSEEALVELKAVLKKENLLND